MREGVQYSLVLEFERHQNVLLFEKYWTPVESLLEHTRSRTPSLTVGLLPRRQTCLLKHGCFTS